MKLHKGASRVKSLWRFGAISRVLIKHGMGDLTQRLLGEDEDRVREPGMDEPVPSPWFPSPRRIRLALEELGPSFAKLGQLMSTRADMFPPDYIEEFKKLQDRVPPVPFHDIKKVIERELRRPLSEIFADFNRESIAAASVAQVHVARLFSGEKVAVKVIRPGIDKMIRDDIGLMYFLARRIEKTFEVGRIIGVINLVEEFERVIYRELDMLVEAGSIEKFGANFKDIPELCIPKVYWDYSTKSVLVMEHIDGIKMDQVETIKAQGIDPREIALIGLRAFSRQLMQFGFFHGDPHPGNTIVMPDGRVGLVDFGITGYLDEEMMRQIANLFLGYAEHDYDLVMEALVEAGIVNEDRIDMAAFRIDLKDVSEAFYGRSLQHISVKDVYDQVMHLVLKYRIRLPRNLLLLLKTFIQTEALGKILGSDASLLEVVRPYARELLQKGYDARSMLKNIRKDANLMAFYSKTLPRYVSDILKATAVGKMRMELWHGGFEHLGSQLEKGVNRLTVGLIIAASIIAGSLVLNSSQKMFEFTIDLLGPHRLSLTELLGVTGYVIATVLGLRLILSIFRSKKL